MNGSAQTTHLTNVGVTLFLHQTQFLFHGGAGVLRLCDGFPRPSQRQHTHVLRLRCISSRPVRGGRQQMACEPEVPVRIWQDRDPQRVRQRPVLDINKCRDHV